MDGESNKDNNSSEIGSYDNEETSSHDVSEDHQIQNQQFFGTSGVQWSSSPKLPQNNYVEYLSESSASYLPNPMIHGNNYQTLGVGGSSSTFNDSGKAAFGFKLIDSSSNDFGIRKVLIRLINLSMCSEKLKIYFVVRFGNLSFFFFVVFGFSVLGFGEMMKERKLLKLKLEVVKIFFVLRLVN
jgi:hypothetical protein